MPLRRASRLQGLVLLTAATLSACSGQSGSKVAVTPARVVSTPTTPAPLPPTATWALTGLPRPQGSAVGPALSIKVDNAPAARPQSGLDKADLVFECLVEGGLSRFLAVFQSQSTDLVGPIRSARPVDAALLRALKGGIFAYSGAAEGEIAPVRASSTAFLLSNDRSPGPFLKLRSRTAPQNVYANTESLLAGAARLGAKEPAPSPLFRYGPPAAGAVTATDAAVVVGSQATSRWTWQGTSWSRAAGGRPHLLADGSPITAKNVVVLHVKVAGSGIRDAAGNEDPYVLATGSGRAEILRDGLLQRGTWSRPQLSSPYVFTSDAGAAMMLTPGATWVELVPTAGSATYS